MVPSHPAATTARLLINPKISREKKMNESDVPVIKNTRLVAFNDDPTREGRKPGEFHRDVDLVKIRD